MATRRRYIGDWTISEVRTLRDGRAEIHLSTPTQIFVISTRTLPNFKELIDGAGYRHNFLSSLELLEKVCPTKAGE